MATILRNLSYRFPWLYDGISAIAAVSVGGTRRLRTLPLAQLKLPPNSHGLDLCCGGGQVTAHLVKICDRVTALDCAQVALERATARVSNAEFVLGLAEELPFADHTFDLVQTSLALHEMTAEQRQQTFRQVWRVLKPGGIFTFIDFHPPQNPLFWPPLILFLWLFETEAAWGMLRQDFIKQLTNLEFQNPAQSLVAGGSLQVIRAQKPVGIAKK
ncbi:MAG: methyltransferase domain-containing protein [Cyanobacteria bacterium P01_H01_bin.15]